MNKTVHDERECKDETAEDLFAGVSSGFSEKSYVQKASNKKDQGSDRGFDFKRENLCGDLRMKVDPGRYGHGDGESSGG